MPPSNPMTASMVHRGSGSEDESKMLGEPAGNCGSQGSGGVDCDEGGGRAIDHSFNDGGNIAAINKLPVDGHTNEGVNFLADRCKLPKRCVVARIFLSFIASHNLPTLTVFFYLY